MLWGLALSFRRCCFYSRRDSHIGNIIPLAHVRISGHVRQIYLLSGNIQLFPIVFRSSFVDAMMPHKRRLPALLDLQNHIRTACMGAIFLNSLSKMWYVLMGEARHRVQYSDFGLSRL